MSVEQLTAPLGWLVSAVDANTPLQVKTAPLLAGCYIADAATDIFIKLQSLREGIGSSTVLAASPVSAVTGTATSIADKDPVTDDADTPTASVEACVGIILSLRTDTTPTPNTSGATADGCLADSSTVCHVVASSGLILLPSDQVGSLNGVQAVSDMLAEPASVQASHLGTLADTMTHDTVVGSACADQFAADPVSEDAATDITTTTLQLNSRHAVQASSNDDIPSVQNDLVESTVYGESTGATDVLATDLSFDTSNWDFAVTNIQEPIDAIAEEDATFKPIESVIAAVAQQQRGSCIRQHSSYRVPQADAQYLDYDKNSPRYQERARANKERIDANKAKRALEAAARERARARAANWPRPRPRRAHIQGA